MFKSIDKGKSGTLEKDEIKKFVEDNKVNFYKDELNYLVKKIDIIRVLLILMNLKKRCNINSKL